MVKKPLKQPDGFYHVNGQKYKKLVGSRAAVWHGVAYKTSYGREGLTKKDLVYTKNKRIVSRKKHLSAKKEKRLEQHGYFTKKGKFGYVKKTAKKPKKSKSKKSKPNKSKSKKSKK